MKLITGSRQDVGIMLRNLMNREVASAVLNLLFPKMSSAVDFGAGHGVFVRLMRDRGFNFFWSDLHATNDYARGFEYQEGSTYDFLTAFEVLGALDRSGRRHVEVDEPIGQCIRFDLHRSAASTWTI
jgi:hypothetical protein